MILPRGHVIDSALMRKCSEQPQQDWFIYFATEDNSFHVIFKKMRTINCTVFFSFFCCFFVLLHRNRTTQLSKKTVIDLREKTNNKEPLRYKGKSICRDRIIARFARLAAIHQTMPTHTLPCSTQVPSVPQLVGSELEDASVSRA